MTQASKISQWLFGAPPAIFDQEGKVIHQFKPETWDGWKARYQAADYDWRKQVAYMPEPDEKLEGGLGASAKRATPRL